MTVAFFPALNAGFVWDDYTYIIRSDLIHAADGLSRIWFTREPVDFWPLSNTLFFFEWRLWGENPTAYHIVNLLFHFANSCLILLILRRMKFGYAWFTALLFSIHPLAVDAAVWIIQTKTTVATFFALLSCLEFLNFRQTGKWTSWVLSLLAFTASLLTKTSYLALPFLLMIFDSHKAERPYWRRILDLIPFFSIALVIGLIASSWYPDIHLHLTGHRGFGESVADAGYLILFYASKIIFPYPLSFAYGDWSDLPSLWVRYTALMTCVLLLVLAGLSRDKTGLKNLAAFAVLMFPVLGFFEIFFMRYSFAADHWQYPAYAVVIGAVVSQVNRYRFPFPRALGAVICIVSIALTFDRSMAYRDEETVWRDVLTKVPASALAHNNLGNLLMNQGKEEEAKEQYMSVLSRNPDDVEANISLGGYFLNRSQPGMSIPYLQKAIRQNPDSAEGFFNLGLAYAQLNEYSQAIPFYEMAIKLKPTFVPARNGLGISLANTKQTSAARTVYEAALRLEPENGQVHFNLGSLLDGIGEHELALFHFREAERLLPNHPTIRAKVNSFKNLPLKSDKNVN
jgi:tetratricopeptide (TPR) repeat protein